MQLESMLEKCRREQWSIDDLDWSGKPREMSREDEIAICQYFIDMAGIERLAKELFAEQARRATGTLKAIFQTFVVDEERHAQAAERLSKFYDTHHYRAYKTTPALAAFAPHFVDAVRYMSADIANTYITGGELILDVALLRSINDHVGDAMSQRAMDLINRDESRHIAVDFHMVDYYTSQAYADLLASQPPKSIPQQLAAARAMLGLFRHVAPFFKSVFFEPMRVVDPSGKRLKEAFKRIQLIAQPPVARRSDFMKLMTALQDAYNDRPVVRLVFGPVIERIVGVGPELITRLYTEAERERASRMTFDQMAEEALALKTGS
jgi:hypothetical protein